MTLTKAQRLALRGLFGGRCAYCGVELGRIWHADHIEPVGRQLKWIPAGLDPKTKQWRQGRYEPTGILDYPERDRLDNLYPACHLCNIDKSNFSLESWRRHLADGPARLARNYSAYRHSKRFGLVYEPPVPLIFYFELFLGLKRRPMLRR